VCGEDRKGDIPGDAYRATPKAAPGSQADASHYRIRNDRVDKLGLLTLRHAGRLHHLGVGRKHKRERVIILVDQTTATVINQETGEILSRHHQPEQRLLAQPRQKPRPLAGATKEERNTSALSVTNDATQVSPMSRLITLVGRVGLEPTTR
jgi:hypothetical protein